MTKSWITVYINAIVNMPCVINRYVTFILSNFLFLKNYTVLDLYIHLIYWYLTHMIIHDKIFLYCTWQYIFILHINYYFMFLVCDQLLQATIAGVCQSGTPIFCSLCGSQWWPGIEKHLCNFILIIEILFTLNSVRFLTCIKLYICETTGKLYKHLNA